MIKKIVIVFSIILAFVLGLFVEKNFDTSPVQQILNVKSENVRLSGYKYISPLLECEYGNYTRGNQSSTDTFGGSFHPAGIYTVGTAGHDIGVNMDPLSGTEGGGTDRTQAGTVGFFAINLDTLSTGGEPETPSLSQLMRHGKWFSTTGEIQPFTF